MEKTSLSLQQTLAAMLPVLAAGPELKLAPLMTWPRGEKHRGLTRLSGQLAKPKNERKKMGKKRNERCPDCGRKNKRCECDKASKLVADVFGAPGYILHCGADDMTDDELAEHIANGWKFPLSDADTGKVLIFDTHTEAEQYAVTVMAGHPYRIQPLSRAELELAEAGELFPDHQIDFAEAVK